MISDNYFNYFEQYANYGGMPDITSGNIPSTQDAFVSNLPSSGAIGGNASFANDVSPVGTQGYNTSGQQNIATNQTSTSTASGIGGMSAGGLVGSGLGALGAGLSIFGAIGAMNTSKEISQISQQEGEQEIGINQLRRQQVQLMAQRQTMETYRNTQKARAMGLAAGVGQTGSTTGSGVLGGMAGSSASGAQNTRNISQNLGLANQTFNIMDNIDLEQIQIAGLQGQQAQMQGWMSIGAGILGSAGKIAGFI